MLSVRRCFCAACIVELNGPPVCVDSADAKSPPGEPLARGFSGDSTPDPERVGKPGFMGIGISPVTFRRTGGRIEDDAPVPWVRLTPGEVSLGLSLSENPENGVVSVPRACRRAFSCFACTDRKCRSSSCHLISSRPILDRVESAAIDLDNSVSEE